AAAGAAERPDGAADRRDGGGPPAPDADAAGGAQHPQAWAPSAADPRFPAGAGAGGPPSGGPAARRDAAPRPPPGGPAVRSGRRFRGAAARSAPGRAGGLSGPL